MTSQSRGSCHHPHRLCTSQSRTYQHVLSFIPHGLQRLTVAVKSDVPVYNNQSNVRSYSYATVPQWMYENAHPRYRDQLGRPRHFNDNITQLNLISVTILLPAIKNIDLALAVDWNMTPPVMTSVSNRVEEVDDAPQYFQTQLCSTTER